MKAALIGIALAILAGCATLQHMMPGQREAAQHAEDMRELNLRVMRFADEYAGRVREVMQRFQVTAPQPEARLAAQNWKVQQVESAYTVASGPNPVSNALDMVVLATLSRLVIDDLWIGEQYGTRARQIQETHRALEQDAWELLDGVLTDTQRQQLRDLIMRWRAENPNVRAVGYIHFRDFAKSIGSPGPGEDQSPGNLFSILGLDPFSQLDPAIREVTQTRELAERAIFYMQRTPRLLDMEVERIAYQLAVMPEAKSLLGDLDRASLVGTAADRLATSLPDIVAREREALVSQLIQELEDRRTTISSLTGDLRSTLQAGTETSDSLHATLETLDHIVARFPPKSVDSSAAAASRPFDITEYTQMIRELALTTRELNALAQQADSALPAVRAVTQDAADRFEHILDDMFRQLRWLVVLAIVGALVAAIIYRALALWMQRAAARDA